MPRTNFRANKTRWHRGRDTIGSYTRVYFKRGAGPVIRAEQIVDRTAALFDLFRQFVRLSTMGDRESSVPVVLCYKNMFLRQNYTLEMICDCRLGARSEIFMYFQSGQNLIAIGLLLEKDDRRSGVLYFLLLWYQS